MRGGRQFDPGLLPKPLKKLFNVAKQARMRKLKLRGMLQARRAGARAPLASPPDQPQDQALPTSPENPGDQLPDERAVEE